MQSFFKSFLFSKTDPENQDYEMENGAIRNFESLRLAEKQAEAEAIQKKEAEENNPMQVLENRTRDSRREMDVLETLEDLRERNAANYAGVDPKVLLKAEEEYQKQLLLLEKQEDEEEIKKIFSEKYSKSEEFEEVVIESNIVNNKTKKSDQSVSYFDFYLNLKYNKTVRGFKLKDDSISKKIKIEQQDEVEQKPAVLFKKNNMDPPSSKPLVGQLKKNNVASFIKKKTVEIKPEPIENVESAEAKTSQVETKPTGSLLSMMSSYADSSDESE